MDDHKPYKAQSYIYARNEQEVNELTRALTGFVRERYHSGTLVRAESIVRALEAFGNNPMLINYLRK